MARRLHVVAPAKVNLFLGVGDPLPDGYHRLDAVFHAVELHDELIVTEADQLSITCVPHVGVPDEENLAFKAARVFAEMVERDPLVHIELTKWIPHGSGLGGGSSDAAAVIVALATLWGLDPHGPLCHLAASSLGADVPFFLHGGAMLMAGRGDEPVRELPPLQTPLVLVRPLQPVSTADAYRAFDRAPVPAGSPDEVLSALNDADPVALGAALSNNFEPISTLLVPEIGTALDWLRDFDDVAGAIVAGSGSAVFGVVASDEIAEDIAEKARERGWWAEATNLDAGGARVIDEEGWE